MYTTCNTISLATRIREWHTSLRNANRYDLCTVRLLQGACFDSNNPGPECYLRKAARKWFDTALTDHQFSKAQKLAAIYGQLFGDDSNELFDQVAAARAGKPIKN